MITAPRCLRQKFAALIARPLWMKRVARSPKVCELCLATLLLSGCASLLPPAGGALVSDKCRSIDSQYRTWGIVARGGAVGSLGLNVSSLASDSNTGRGLRIAGAGVGVLSAVSAFLQADAARRYVANCTKNLGSAAGTARAHIGARR